MKFCVWFVLLFACHFSSAMRMPFFPREKIWSVLKISKWFLTYQKYKESIVHGPITYESVQEKDPETGMTPAHFAAIYDTDGDFLEALYHADPLIVTHSDKNGNQPLHTAALSGNLITAKLLLSYNANPNAKTSELDKTPAHRAVYAQHNAFELLKLLKDKGADLNCTDKNGNTPLALAVFNDRSELASQLFDLIANPPIIKKTVRFKVRDNEDKELRDLIQQLAQLQCQQCQKT